MKTSHLAPLLVLTLAAAGLAGCGSPSAAGTDFVDGKNFTMAMGSDPGSLDPHASPAGSNMQLAELAYDSLVAFQPDGSVVPQLATSWKVAPTSLTFEIRDGVTCSDGSPFTAQTVAANIAYVADPKNASTVLGVYLPVGASASAQGSTVTVTLTTPSPFALNSLALFPMVCDSGLANRAGLATKTAGTGPFVLKEAVSGDHYVYDVRKGYTWGPDGAATAAKGMPGQVNVKIIANETTAANELLSGSTNAATIVGPDTKRLQAAKLDSDEIPAAVGTQWYNQASDHLTGEPAVRMALTRALDLATLRQALTSGTGTAPTQLSVAIPTACTGDSISGAVPTTDVAAAKAALDQAGWIPGSDGIRARNGTKLALNFGYESFRGAGGSAAAELAIAAWKEIGVAVTPRAMSQNDLLNTLYSTRDWDIFWVAPNLSTPELFMPFVFGPPPPAGQNVAQIENKDYTALRAKALEKTGADSCPDWLAAEKALVSAADVVPYANSVARTFAKGAVFDSTGIIAPTSIRMLG